MHIQAAGAEGAVKWVNTNGRDSSRSPCHSPRRRGVVAVVAVICQLLLARPPTIPPRHGVHPAASNRHPRANPTAAGARGGCGRVRFSGLKQLH
jgi:hypothetical protein